MADNRIAYGMLKKAGVDTEGMSPTEAWKKVNELGLKPSEQTKPTKESVNEKARKIAHNVNITSESYESVDRALDTVQSIIDEYGLDKLESFETVDNIPGFGSSNPAAATSKALLLTNAFLKNPNKTYNQLINWMESKKTEYDLEQHFFTTVPNSYTEEKNQCADNLVKLGEIIKFSRLNVCYENNIIESVLTHEMGHVIYGQLFKDSNKSAVVKQVYEKSVERGDIYSLSYRAAKNEREFFSEALSLYKLKQEQIPGYISNLMKEVLK